MSDIKIFAKTIDELALEQIYKLGAMPAFKDSKIRIMPDVHAGAGCVIGFTGNLGDKVIPNIVGVDIGCGMLCVELGKIELDLEKLDNVIRKFIPSGMNVHDEKHNDLDFRELKCFDKLNNKDKWLDRSLGTLGGGNHFIEIDIDDDGNKYLVIHTGSRNLGKQVAEIYQKEAIRHISGVDTLSKDIDMLIENYKKEGRQQEINNAIISLKEEYRKKVPNMPNELCYLEGQSKDDYLHDMKICQKFAVINRCSIANTILYNMGLGNLNNHMHFQCIHNYISFKDNIIRKGAISARKGEKVLIPMNMKEGCIIGVGKGNDDWNQSAPHGAGRIMSRSQAKETLDIEEYKESMKGIYTTSVNEGTIDEAPMVYKPMQEIIDCIKDTIEIERIIKPIYNFKESE